MRDCGCDERQCREEVRVVCGAPFGGCRLRDPFYRGENPVVKDEPREVGECGQGERDGFASELEGDVSLSSRDGGNLNGGKTADVHVICRLFEPTGRIFREG